MSFVEGLNRYVSDKLVNAGANVFQVDKFGLITSQEAFDEANRRPNIELDDSEAMRLGLVHAVAVVPMGQSSDKVSARACE